MASVMEQPATCASTFREVSKIRAAITDAVEDGVRSASRSIQQGRRGAEDMVEEVKHTVKQRPLPAMGVVFAAGLLAGGFLGRMVWRRR